MKIKAINILPIVLALLLPTLRFYSDTELQPSEYEPFIYRRGYSSISLVVFWYFLWQLWDIKEEKRKKYALVLLGIIILLGVLYAQLFGSNLDFKVIWILFPTALILTIQYALKSQQKASHLFLEKEQLQTENYKAQLKTLRTQVDPHFLFNSLNTLRAMVRQNHAGSEQFVLSLSDFYRQTLQHNEHSTVLLSKELAVLQSYLFLMKSRNEQAVQIDMHINGSLYERKIPTMALQIVVENCFKHNSMTSKKPLQIAITSTEGSYITVCNNIQLKLSDHQTKGLGLELLRKRYELLNINEGLLVEQSPEQFQVKLKLV